mgnify:CR=1 FL=1
MRKFWSEVGMLAVLALLAGVVSACNQIGVLKGQMALKDANQYYQKQDYRQASA